MLYSFLGLTPDYLEMDLKTFGFIFECMSIRDLKVYSQAIGGKVSYYHDRYGLEADAVLHIEDGRYALIEFKLGSKEIEEGACHLLKIQELVREYNKTENQVPLRDPDLLIVITCGNMAYTRDDGVKIIPLACLKDKYYEPYLLFIQTSAKYVFLRRFSIMYNYYFIPGNAIIPAIKNTKAITTITPISIAAKESVLL